MQDVETAITTMHNLKKLGLQLAIDDFGTGFSSLSYIKCFPLDALKIDRSFIIDVLEDKQSANIVMAIIDLAHDLNFKVIAEGVETKEQFDLLENFGCDYIQGFFISKPVAAIEFESKLAAA